jgi:uncharacterized repeat protein (TIGR02543 family)
LTDFTLATSGDISATSPTTPSGGVIITSAFPTIPIKSFPGGLTNPAEILTIANAAGAFGVVDDGNQLWATSYSNDAVYSYNDVTGALVNVITAGSVNGAAVATGIDQPNTIVISGNHLFVGNNNDNFVAEFSLAGSPYSGNETPTFVKDIELGSPGPGAVVGRLADDGSYVWATTEAGNEVFKIDASTGTVVATITGIDYPVGITSDGANVWVASYGSGAGDTTVTEINAASAAIENTITVGLGPYSIFSDGTHVWVANRGNTVSPGNTISVIDASTGLVTNTITVGNQPSSVVSDGTDLWVANHGDDTLSEINIATQTVINTFSLPSGGGIYSITATGTHVWVSEQGSNSIVEIGPPLYTVSFNSEGGTAESAISQASYGASIVLPTPTLAGATFNGWYTSASGGSLVGAGGASYTPTSNVTLFAQWSYTVTFNSNFPYVTGGAGSMSNEIHSAATNLTANAFSDTGYTFTGWNTIAGGGGTAYAGGASYPFTASVTLYAQWSANTDTVTFNANTGTGSMSDESYTSGVAKALSANGFTAPAGATFNGWNTAANGSGTAYGAGASITIYASVTLYAQWNSTVTLNFNSEGGSAVSSESGQNGSRVTLPGAPTYSGNTFNGWFSAASGGTLATSPYTLTGDTTLYAQWSVNTETVTFNNNTGTGSMSNETENYNVAANLTANSFAKTGFTFVGWSIQAGGGGTTYLDQASYPFIASVTLYAQWIADTNAVTYNLNGGAGSVPIDPSTHNYATTVAVLFSPTPTKTGYSFTGWSQSSSGSATYTSVGVTTFVMPDNAVTLYAIYIAVVDVISFNSEGGSAVGSMSGPDGSTITLPGAPTLTGDTFDGWFVAPSGGSALTSPFTLVGSTTLDAQWTPNAPINITLEPISVTSSGSTSEFGATYQLAVPDGALSATFSVGSSSNSVCTVSPSGLVTLSGAAGTCEIVATVQGAGGTGPQIILENIVVAPLALSASIKTVAGTLLPVVNQIVKVAQPITLKLPTGSKIVKVTVNGKLVTATVNASGQLQLPFLIGPKDKVVVSVDVNGVPVSVPVAPENGRIALANVNFDFASSSLTAKAKEILQRVARVIFQHGFTKVNLVGFTDVLTSANFSNQVLSDQRAAAVKAYLLSLLGSAKVTITLNGLAARDPIINSLAPRARAVNRRVEIVVQ